MTEPIRSMPALPHVFEIAWDVWRALTASEEEILATIAGMQEMGIYELPYCAGEIIVRLRIPNDSKAEVFHEARGLREGEEFKEEFIVYPNVPRHAIDWYRQNRANCTTPEGETLVDRGITVEKKRIVHRFGLRYEPEESRKYFRDGLIVLLASKGMVKQSKETKLAKLGIGKKDNEYVTTIRLGQSLECDGSTKAGSPVRPHLRRGHVRMQPHGPANSLRKKIWVEPCFVNADEDFVNQRKAYRVRH